MFTIHKKEGENQGNIKKIVLKKIRQFHGQKDNQIKKKHYTDNQRLINKGNSRIPLFLRQLQTLLNRLRIQVLLNSQQFLLHIVASVLFMGSINLFIIMSQLRKKGKIMVTCDTDFQ